MHVFACFHSNRRKYMPNAMYCREGKCTKVAKNFFITILNETNANEDNDEETVIYKIYTLDNNDQMHGWEDVLSNGNFTECVSWDAELSTCDSEEKKNEDSESSEDDEEMEIKLKKVTLEEAVCYLNLKKIIFVSWGWWCSLES